ncbi:putative formin-like protein 5 [Iris pallida]|uniref:Formin-like protein 5 n=1 Tax=Iris pallida TaxID=29817 RepID=A0AAX6GLZ6_IRIPA|nr:putative formin-like protein 5 [Iris pallida]KAJ6829552.1 putative formin-like protein 5 [Iris pallida]
MLGLRSTTMEEVVADGEGEGEGKKGEGSHQSSDEGVVRPEVRVSVCQLELTGSRVPAAASLEGGGFRGKWWLGCVCLFVFGVMVVVAVRDGCVEANSGGHMVMAVVLGDHTTTVTWWSSEQDEWSRPGGAVRHGVSGT